MDINYNEASNEVIIESSRVGHGPYKVTMNAAGKAAHCPCIGFRRWKKCWHCELAELAKRFQLAKDWMEGVAPKGFDFNAKFQATVAAAEEAGEKYPVLVATKRVIEKARELFRATRRVNTRSKLSPKTQASEGACPRCGGEGWIPCFKHVEGGICFRCRGAGVDPR